MLRAVQNGACSGQRCDRSLILGQIGEFAFVLAAVGLANQVLDPVGRSIGPFSGSGCGAILAAP